MKNGKEQYVYLLLADTAFYCCLGGEDEGGVSRFCLGTEIKNLILKIE
jgi:hypothetical protein